MQTADTRKLASPSRRGRGLLCVGLRKDNVDSTSGLDERELSRTPNCVQLYRFEGQVAGGDKGECPAQSGGQDSPPGLLGGHLFW